MPIKRLRGLLLLPPAFLVGGCNLVLLDPAGDVARQQSDLMIASVILMSLIIIPVLIAIGVIAWRYRASNTDAAYDPEWDHSTKFELVVWAAPLLIIIVLGAMTWIGTHQLDPYRSLTRIDASRAVAPGTQPLEVEVVSLDWKWLFFYPKYGIATVNELAAPVDMPIHFKLTSTTMMNSFFIPSLAGQVYTMPGMQTVLNAVINKPGDFDGFSSNYSGHGFTDMRFRFHGMNQPQFDQWVARVRADGSDLNAAAFQQLNEPSRAEPVHHYAHFDRDLYERILHRCLGDDPSCMNKTMSMDAGQTSATHGAAMSAQSTMAPASTAAMH